jgi:hypothetical protein
VYTPLDNIAYPGGFLCVPDKIKTIMQKTFTFLFVFAGLGLFAQSKTSSPAQTQPVNPRTTVTSVQSDDQQDPKNNRTVSSTVQTRTSETPYLGYDMNEKYMGRTAEFLNVLNVPELPADFPVYDKAWSLKDYNGVVDAYYINHMDLLKPKYKQKIEALKNRQ